MRLYLKNNQSKKGWGVAQSVELLPSKCETLSSNCTNAKKKKKERKKGRGRGREREREGGRKRARKRKKKVT
jgi:hypothetical protein